MHTQAQCFSWPRRKRAFTLLEILVAVVVIALLASLVLALASRAKSAAKTAPCASNLRQIGQALSIYEADFNSLPPSISHLHKSSYAQDPRLFVCTEDPTGRWVTLQRGFPPGSTIPFDLSYDSIFDQTSMLQKVREADANFGMVTCRMHGERTRRFRLDFDGAEGLHAFDGLLLRLRYDASVQRARLRVRGPGQLLRFEVWELWTDEANPFRKMGRDPR